LVKIKAAVENRINENSKENMILDLDDPTNAIAIINLRANWILPIAMCIPSRLPIIFRKRREEKTISYH